MGTYYKVVLRDGPHSYGSAVVERADLWCWYRIGQVTRPPVGALMAFRSLELARKWVARWDPALSRQVVFLVGYGRKSVYQLPRAWLHGSCVELGRQWRSTRKLPKRKDRFYISWPTGTVLLSSFQPIGEVE